MRVLLILMALLWAMPAHAQAPEARVEATLRGGPTFLAGQRVTIDVKLLTTTSFVGAPAFDLPSLPGALLMKVEDRPLLGSETIQGVSFVSQTHELALFAQQAGGLVLPAIPVRFASAGVDGGPAQNHRLETAPVTVDVALPQGATGSGPFVVGSGVTMTERWQPDVEELRPGDALTRIVTLQAIDVPAMLLPSLDPGPIEGLHAYPRPPEVSDRQTRGTFTGIRVEQITFMAETPGGASIPAISLRWWEASSGRARMVSLPSRTFRVLADAGGAGPSPPPAVAEPGADAWRYMPVVALAMLAVAALAWMMLARRRRPSQDGESQAFRLLDRALRAGDAREAQSALFAWLDRVPGLPGPARLEDLRARLGAEPDLDTELARLLRAAAAGGAWRGERLRACLRRCRPQLAEVGRAGRTATLQPLNP